MSFQTAVHTVLTTCPLRAALVVRRAPLLHPCNKGVELQLWPHRRFLTLESHVLQTAAPVLLYSLGGHQSSLLWGWYLRGHVMGAFDMET